MMMSCQCVIVVLLTSPIQPCLCGFPVIIPAGASIKTESNDDIVLILEHAGIFTGLMMSLHMFPSVTVELLLQPGFYTVTSTIVQPRFECESNLIRDH